ncbi:MAG: hypothetical protein HFJ28_02205 [Clostridia bacterium]|nr:hypothetical protein [Clostridia bacterium]
MKFLTQTRTTHKIIIAIVFVILFNFISPNLSIASAASTAGGILFEPIKDLLLVIADGIITLVQSILFGMDASFMTIRYDKDWVPTAVRSGFRSYCRRRCNCNRYSRRTIYRRI